MDGLTFHGSSPLGRHQMGDGGRRRSHREAWLGHADPSLVLRLNAHTSDAASRRSAVTITRDVWAD